MKRKIMIIGAGRGQVSLIKTAQRMGLEVSVVTHADHYPGVPLADKVLHANILEPESVLAVAKGEGFEGVATACLDTGVEALGYVCDNLGLSGLSYAAAKKARDKLRMKQALTAAGVPTAKFRQITDKNALQDALCELELPLIIKAVDLQGSRGIYICRTKEDVLANYELVMSQTNKNYCILEEFIVGREFGTEAFVHNGEVLFVLPHGKNNYLSHTGVPIGHYAPLDRPDEFIAQVEEVVRGGIAALGLDNCAVNVDLIERDGKVYIIELTGRVGANGIPELVSLYFGIDYFEMIIACAMGDDPSEIFAKRLKVPQPNASRMLTTEQSGEVLEIINKNDKDDPRICDLPFFVGPGDEVRKFINSNDCVGQTIVIGDSYESCDAKIEQIKNNVQIVLK